MTDTERNEAKPLHVYQNEVIDSIVATSEEEARQIAYEYTEQSEEYSDLEYTQRPDDMPLTIHDDEGGKEIKTCAEWCARNGKGFLCSTEY